MTRTAAVVLLLVPAGAVAQSSRSEERAVELFKQARAHYHEGRFREAAALLKVAHQLKPEPVLLYNLARAYEGLGDFAAALVAYRRYLSDEPAARDRGAIEQRMATLVRQIREHAALERARAALRPPPTDAAATRTRGRSWAPWLLLGAGIAAAGTGVALGVAARGRHQDAVAEPSAVRAEELQDQANRLAAATNVAVAVGSTAALAGAIWLVVDLARAGRGETRGPGRATLGASLGLAAFWWRTEF